MPDNAEIVAILSKDIDDVLDWLHYDNDAISIATLEKIRLVLADAQQPEIVRLHAVEVFQVIDFEVNSVESAKFMLALCDTLLGTYRGTSSVALRSSIRIIALSVLAIIHRAGIAELRGEAPWPKKNP